jgi:hypothetical protein
MYILIQLSEMYIATIRTKALQIARDKIKNIGSEICGKKSEGGKLKYPFFLEIFPQFVRGFK